MLFIFNWNCPRSLHPPQVVKQRRKTKIEIRDVVNIAVGWRADIRSGASSTDCKKHVFLSYMFHAITRTGLAAVWLTTLYRNPIYVFPEMKLRSLFPIPTFMYLWAIYIFPGSVCLFGCSKIGRLILGIYKPFTESWMWKLRDGTL